MALTLLQLRTRVKERYERNGSSNDASTALLNMFVNDALREAINFAGDEAHFMRSSQVVNLVAYPATNTMPSTMKRVYRIEDEVYSPGCQIPWKYIRHTAANELVIVVERGGDLTVQYLNANVWLVADSDPTPIPEEHGEMIVVMACRRLAESVGNAALLANLRNEEVQLMRVFKRDCQRYGGMRHEPISIWGI